MRELNKVGLALLTAVAAVGLVGSCFLPSGAQAAGDFIIMPRAELMALPTSGTAYSNLLSYASKTASSPDVSDQDDPDNVVVLAKALVAARTDNATRKAEVITALKAVQGTESGTRALALGRELAAYVLSADLIGYRDPAFVSWVSKMRTVATTSGPTSLTKCQEQRPNNWGMHCGASRVAADLYVGDTTDLNKAFAIFKGWLGDRSSYASFTYGDLSWQADSAHPVGINPKGATKSGVNIDGVLPDDMRRGGSFPTIGTDGVSYTWEALQGAFLEAELFRRAGMDVYSFEDSALARAAKFMYGKGHPASGDDEWQVSLINARYGTNYAEPSGAQPGKNFGFTDWLTLAPASVPSSTPTPATPTPTVAPTPTPTVAPTPTPTVEPTPSPSSCPVVATPAPVTVTDAINADTTLSAEDKARLIDLYGRFTQ